MSTSEIVQWWAAGTWLLGTVAISILYFRFAWLAHRTLMRMETLCTRLEAAERKRGLNPPIWPGVELLPFTGGR